MTNAKQRAKIIIGLAIITIFFGLATGAFTAKAEDRPSPADLQKLEYIRKNQEGIKESRPYYEALVSTIEQRKNIEGSDGDGYNKFVQGYNDFLDFKRWNEAEVAELAKNGWCPVWNEDPNKITLERCSLASVTQVETTTPAISNSTAEVKQWAWKDAPAYKNERLAYYQQKLRDVGITDTEWHKWLSAQLIQENGSFNEAGIYHGNCIFGIPQFNACGRHGMSATRWLELHPEWKDWRFQIDQLAAEVGARKEIFDGELSCVILAHFHPNGKNGARGRYASKGHCKEHRYYHTEVAQRLPLLIQTENL